MVLVVLVVLVVLELELELAKKTGLATRGEERL